MAQRKRTAKRSPKDLKRRPRAEDRAIHILMPYILGLIALFLGLCFLLGKEKLGFLGNISTLLAGLFSVGAYACPIFLLLHAVFYKRDLEAGSYLYKFWFSFADMAFLGVICGMFSGKEPTFLPDQNFSGGIKFQTGGLIGGTLYALLDAVVGIFAPVIALIAVIVFTTFLFGKTPADLIRAVIYPLIEKWKEGYEVVGEAVTIKKYKGTTAEVEIPACMIEEQIDKQVEEFSYQVQRNGMSGEGCQFSILTFSTIRNTWKSCQCFRHRRN